MVLNRPCPVELPYSKVGVSMEADQNAGCTSGIPDHKADESLSIYCVVRDASGLGRRFQQLRWLKQDSFL
jgi:hypothetical protein